MDGCRRPKLLFLAISTILPIVALLSTAIAQTAREEGPQKEGWRRIGSSVVKTGSNATKIMVVGNAVLVPVTVAYKENEVDVLLLLDTGSSRTVVNSEIADRLNINLTEAKKMRLQVVGGALIEARQIRLSSITVGPHTTKNTHILIVDHKGPPVKHDGLLGMDLLRGLKYNVDLEERIIRWE
jgi:predicted aspartyl protease